MGSSQVDHVIIKVCVISVFSKHI